MVNMVSQNLDLCKLAKELQHEPHSCIQKITCKEITILIHPMYFNNVKKGIEIEMKSMIKTYSSEIGGILLGYESLKVEIPRGWLFHSNPFMHVNVKGDFYVFAPTIGCTLKGTVVKKSPNHVGSLVHGVFNASSSVPLAMKRENWCGSKVKEGDTINLVISELKLNNVVPYLRGDIVPESVSTPSASQSSLGIESVRSLFDEDSGVSSISSSIDEVPSKKKKKKRKSGASDVLEDSANVEDEVFESNDCEISELKPKIKRSKKIKKEICDYNNESQLKFTEEMECPSSSVLDATPQRKSKKRKMENESNEETLEHSVSRKKKRKREDTDSNNEISDTYVSKKKKKKSKSNSFSECDTKMEKKLKKIKPDLDVTNELLKNVTFKTEFESPRIKKVKFKTELNS